MNVSAISATSAAIQGLNKAQETVAQAAQTVANSNLPISGASQTGPAPGPNLTGALVSLMSAKISFQADAEMIKTNDKMFQTLINSI